MKRLFFILISFIGLLFFIQDSKAFDVDCVKWNPGHYVMLTWKYKKLDPEPFIASLDKTIKGLQIVLSWRDLEFEKNEYNFNKIEKILALLKKYDKRLFIQVSERSFKNDENPIPNYLYEEPEYEGGAESFKTEGSVAKIWNPAVLKRFNNLIKALGNRFDCDPALEGITFPETAIGIDRKKAKNFSTSKYVNAMKLRLQAAKKAFPRSVVIQYINYLPKEELEAFIRYCHETGVGMGGPDLVPDIGRYENKKRIPAYHYYNLYAGKMPLAVAVQSPNFTRKKGIFTLDDFWDMGVNKLKLNYIFWAAVEGRKYTYSFSRDIAPYIKKKLGKISTQCPGNLPGCCHSQDGQKP